MAHLPQTLAATKHVTGRVQFIGEYDLRNAFSSLYFIQTMRESIFSMWDWGRGSNATDKTRLVNGDLDTCVGGVVTNAVPRLQGRGYGRDTRITLREETEKDRKLWKRAMGKI